MGFKMVEIVGEDVFRKLEWRIVDHEYRSLIRVSSERIHGCTECIYHLPSYGNITVDAKNSFEAMRGLCSALKYIK
ncbi:hypothetical protein HYU07_01215 [Candidatus Woesearchaeota archaeon]|nr:hypothetical protein [Candidatus Woesearchaeota archaeon]